MLGEANTGQDYVCMCGVGHIVGESRREATGNQETQKAGRSGR